MAKIKQERLFKPLRRNPRFLALFEGEPAKSQQAQAEHVKGPGFGNRRNVVDKLRANAKRPPTISGGLPTGVPGERCRITRAGAAVVEGDIV